MKYCSANSIKKCANNQKIKDFTIFEARKKCQRKSAHDVYFWQTLRRVIALDSNQIHEWKRYEKRVCGETETNACVYRLNEKQHPLTYLSLSLLLLNILLVLSSSSFTFGSPWMRVAFFSPLCKGSRKQSFRNVASVLDVSVCVCDSCGIIKFEAKIHLFFLRLPLFRSFHARFTFVRLLAHDTFRWWIHIIYKMISGRTRSLSLNLNGLFIYSFEASKSKR